MTKNSEIGERLKFRKLGSQLRARLFEELGEVVAHRFEASSVLEQACTGLLPSRIWRVRWCIRCVHGSLFFYKKILEGFFLSNREFVEDMSVASFYC
jgi:hypothetical protein